MYKTLKNNWALFIGFAILATAHGFQGNLLGVRAVIEEFNYLAVRALFVRIFLRLFLRSILLSKTY